MFSNAGSNPARRTKNIKMTIENVDFLKIESDLKEKLKEKYKKIYVQYSRLGSVCLTCFLYGYKGYRIFSLMKMNIRDVNSDFLYFYIIKNE